MICNNCGKEIPNNSTNCPFCNNTSIINNQTEKKNNNKKKDLTAILICVGILIVAAIILSIVIGNNTSNSTTTTNTSSNTKTNINSKQTSAFIGQSVSNSDNVVFSILSVNNTKTIGTSDLLSDTTQNNFIIISLSVTNNGNKPIELYSGLIDLFDSNNIKYSEFSSLYLDNYIIYETINPGISKNFQVAFEVPKTSNEELFTAKIGYSKYTSDNNRVIFILKQNSS